MSSPSAPRPGSEQSKAARSRVTGPDSSGCDKQDCLALSPDEEGDPEPAGLEAVSAKLHNNLQELSQTYRELEDAVTATTETILFFVDDELKLQRFTRNTVELFGLRDRDRGRPIAAIAERLNYPMLEEHTTEVLRKAAGIETELRGPNGRWYQARLKPDFIAVGKLGGVVITLMDISDRKQAEHSSRRANRFAEKILETLPEPLVVLTEDFRIASANPAFYRTFHYDRAAVDNQSILHIGGGEWDCPQFRELLQRILPCNESLQGFELSHQFSGLGKRTLSLNLSRLDDEQLILLTVHDITPMREVDALRRRATTLVDEVDVRRRLQDMASAVLQSGTMEEMCKYALNAVMDLSGSDFCSLQIVGEDGSLELAAQRGMDEARLRDFLCSNRHEDVSFARAFHERCRVAVEDVRQAPGYRPLLPQIEGLGFRSFQSAPLIGRSGKLLGVLSTFSSDPRTFREWDEYVLSLLALEIADLCEWLKTEKRLRQSETRLRAQSEQLLANDRQKNQFLGLLGHELRNPLTVMRNSIQTLVQEEQGLATDGRLAQALALLERQSRHMTHLVNDLLDVTRINNGKVVLKRDRVSLARCLEEVVAAHRSTLVSRELNFSVQQPSQAIYVDADAARLFQVLDNLLTNAIKFTQPGGQVSVAMMTEGEKAILAVKDSGIGIPPESLGSLFDPFTQVDNHLACHGLGLGLSLVKSLVDLHGGHISVFSEGEDRGSEFVIRWPLHERQCEPGGDAAPPALHANTSARPQRILVVDDIRDIADSFARLLEVAGHEVLVGYDAEQGLALAKQHRPTVAFLDMAMPETDGLELARQLRREFSSWELTLVMVSGYGHNQDIEKAQAAGFDHHLLKPIELQQVYKLLDTLAMSE